MLPWLFIKNVTKQFCDDEVSLAKICRLFKENFEKRTCSSTACLKVQLFVSIKKCSTESVSRASAFRIIWWNADSSMNCYKGKYAHKITLNFYANELQISWADFIFSTERSCSDNVLFCSSGKLSFLLLVKAFPTAFVLYIRSQNSRLGKLTYRSCWILKPKSISNVFSSVWCVFIALEKEVSVASGCKKFCHFTSGTVPPFLPLPTCFDHQSNFREMVCS